jgi:uracil-DNA glycosylase
MIPILLLAEARGEAEARHSSTLIGPSGIELIRMMAEAEMITLTEADHSRINAYYATQDNHHIIRIWDAHPEVHRTNVFNIHPPGNHMGHFLGAKLNAIPGYPICKLTLDKRHPKPDGNFIRAEFAPELERLGDELLNHNPNIIVCLGNVALWALTGHTGIGKIRGTTLVSSLTVAGFKLLPTYHPAAILRAWDNRPVLIADLMKAKRESAFPEIRRPEREIWVEPTIADIEEFIDQHVRGCDLLSVDIETSGDRVTCIGFGPSPNLALVVPFDDERATRGSYWADPADEHHAWRLVRSILEDPSIPKLFQNGAYDIVFLWRSMSIRTFGAVHDTMLMHHAMQPEALKSLGFLGSVYSDEASWKDMRKAKTIKRDD